MLSRRAFGLGAVGTLAIVAAGAPILWSIVDEDAVIRAATRTLFPPTDGSVDPDTLDVPGAIRRYLAVLPERQRWEARGLLRLIELGAVPGARFSRLTDAERTAALEAMAAASLAHRRLLVGSLKQLCAMGYWQHPETWAFLGYEGPTVRTP
jgi:hypothetical protein